MARRCWTVLTIKTVDDFISALMDTAASAPKGSSESFKDMINIVCLEYDVADGIVEDTTIEINRVFNKRGPEILWRTCWAIQRERANNESS